jgi:hypothetical protein
MDDPHMIAFVYMDAGDLAQDPIIGKRLRPERIHLELGRRPRIRAGRDLGSLRHRRAPLRRNVARRKIDHLWRRSRSSLLPLTRSRPDDGQAGQGERREEICNS